MTCPKCSETTKVVDSRVEVDSVWRRRECQNCGYRFNTTEIDVDMYERLVRQNDKGQRNAKRV